MEGNKWRLNFAGYLMLLVFCALLLTARLIYLYLDNPSRFPISTVKVSATYQHITRSQLENILSGYLDSSFIAQ
jgi:cell division protein FtsQ